MSDLRTYDDHPDVDPADWELRVEGTVTHPRSHSLADLRAHDLVTVTGDFHCREGWTAEDLTWRGVELRDLIEAVEPTAESAHALVDAIDDDYACAFELDRLEGAVLALELDGEPLPVEHGGPARLVLPGEESDCWESIKWVRQITIHESAPTEADTAADIALSRIE